MTDQTADFDFDLPEHSIAHHPMRPKDLAKLLYIPAQHNLEDKIIRDLPSFFREGDILVANDTKVIHAKLSAMRGAAHIGITLDRPMGDGRWHVLIKNSRRLKVGDKLDFPDGNVYATVDELETGGSGFIRFSVEGDTFDEWLRNIGQLALPPYIERPQGPTEQDEKDYHTIFSHHPGAVAAPTAGLHFTDELLTELDQIGVERLTLTLHVGAGTFLPVRSDNINDHHMHAEYGIITPEVAKRLNQAKAEKRRIIAVGTTSLRLLESAVDEHGIIHPFHKETSIFILPGYQFKAVDMLMTNFHLPRSTLFMLVCAFGGTEKLRHAYQHAIQSGYRFYSYGDACLIEGQSM
ncbi:tRNA preQ1(34) S-adenosylmethionine ribosyltransferase-isomerase QueA [Commensalibacter oyaizuii]|uniref:S-adenosylmethionine:tRNA ribosyltransferase-isomerase n=1 Tax=Commensalibacter oyaizuii TaxID=3043873 RepID=A0ABT6Q3Z8_9PROT|nr:tRNA preQ1(34) S-adenosylmethionine ribosyltransferase-isomerase QueA [Commensalibacter sp. TBRC 16381]MDI2091824.1 tRNA preQ1(34) S-adenosylmethionine ribosyltransferase-isomerase QueA [Commensalibacter sp. TBRC 16381]